MIIRIFTHRRWSKIEAVRRVVPDLLRDYEYAKLLRSGKHDGEFRWMEFDVEPRKLQFKFKEGKFRWVYR